MSFGNSSFSVFYFSQDAISDFFDFIDGVPSIGKVRAVAVEFVRVKNSGTQIGANGFGIESDSFELFDSGLPIIAVGCIFGFGCRLSSAVVLGLYRCCLIGGWSFMGFAGDRINDPLETR